MGLEGAQELVISKVSRIPRENVSILDAGGRILFENLFADQNLPPYAQSAVDGFALGSCTTNSNSRYTIKKYLELSDFPDIPLKNGEAVGVLTGGALPDGCQAVVPHEKTVVEGDTLTVLEEIKPGNNVKQVGEDFQQGSLLAQGGIKIDAGCIGLLAAYGFWKIPVYRQPRVAILSLGLNIISCHLTPKPGQTRDSNSPFLAALIKQHGGVVASIDVISQMDLIKKGTYIDQIIEQVDLVICTGETYTQKANEIRLLMDTIGAEIIYWGIPIQPGSHNGAAFYKGRPIFALSGNPAACAVGYHLFVAPALRTMQGLYPYAQRLQAKCINSFSKIAHSRRFVRGYAACSSGDWKVTVLPGQKPSMLRSLISCNALIDLPPGHSPVTAGTEVSILLLES